jgi:hypothetical protein
MGERGVNRVLMARLLELLFGHYRNNRGLDGAFDTCTTSTVGLIPLRVPALFNNLSCLHLSYLSAHIIHVIIIISLFSFPGTNGVQLNQYPGTVSRPNDASTLKNHESRTKEFGSSRRSASDVVGLS